MLEYWLEAERIPPSSTACGARSTSARTLLPNKVRYRDQMR
jgi:hypothetical protein